MNKKFSNGGSVLKAMKDMVQEQKGPEDVSHLGMEIQFLASISGT